MNRLFLFTAVVLLVASKNVDAQIPGTMSYQGILVDNNNVIVADGDYNISFSIYDVATGGGALWTEAQVVTVASGRFNVVLGSVTPIPLAFDIPYWLGITVEADPEMSPRIELTGTPYAFNARRAGSVDVVSSADITDGPGVASAIDQSQFIPTGSVEVVVSREITVPGPGFVFAIATAELVAVHTNGSEDGLLLAVADNCCAINPFETVEFIVPATYPTGLPFRIPATVHGIFEVSSAGTETFYFLVQEFNGDMRLNNKQLTLIYVPTAYGTVTPSPVSSDLASKSAVEGRQPGMAEDPTTRTGAPGLATVAGVEREIQVIRQRLLELEAQLASGSEVADR